MNTAVRPLQFKFKTLLSLHKFFRGISADKVIDAMKGNRLMIDGLFGYVRYPNLTGEMMMVISWSLLCGEWFCQLQTSDNLTNN